MEKDIETQVRDFEREFSQATGEARQALMTRVQKVVAGFVHRGQKVPEPLSRINQRLVDEAFEDMFDNVPL